MYTRHACASKQRPVPVQPNAVSPDRQDRRHLPSIAIAGTTRNETRGNDTGATAHNGQVHRNDDDRMTFPMLFQPQNPEQHTRSNHATALPNKPMDIVGGELTDGSTSVQTVSSAELRSCRRQLHRRELPSDISSYASSTTDTEVAMDPTVGAFNLRGNFITDFNIVHVEVRGSKMQRNILLQYRTNNDSDTFTRVVPFDKFNTASHELIYAATHHPQDGRGKIDTVDPESGEIYYEIEKFMEYDESTDMVLVKWAFTQEPSMQWIARNDIRDITIEEIKEEISENDISSL